MTTKTSNQLVIEITCADRILTVFRKPKADKHDFIPPERHPVNIVRNRELFHEIAFNCSCKSVFHAEHVDLHTWREKQTRDLSKDTSYATFSPL